MSQRIVSFVVDAENLKKINDIDELRILIDECRNNSIPLKDLDLSGVEIKNIEMNRLDIENVIFNTYDVERSDYKSIYNVSFKGARLTRVSFAQCFFERCNFDNDEPTISECIKLQEKSFTDISKTIIKEADFFMCRWDSCRLRRSYVDVADFRYSEFVNCSLGGCHIRLGDFYMTAFRGTTNFIDSVFELCSFTNVLFENGCIRMKGINKLVQECYKDYKEIIIEHKNWYKQNPCADFSHHDIRGKSDTYKEASVMYAQLSGLYAGKGFFKDSNIAYEKAKRNEAWANLHEMKDECRNILSLLVFKKKKVKLDKIIKDLFSLLNFSICWTLALAIS